MSLVMNKMLFACARFTRTSQFVTRGSRIGSYYIDRRHHDQDSGDRSSHAGSEEASASQSDVSSNE
jgi:hypothetical protein